MKISSNKNQNSRRKLLFWVTGAISATMFWRLFRKAENKGKRAKLLTEDGQLVEVEFRHLTGDGRLASTEEIQAWVKYNQ